MTSLAYGLMLCAGAATVASAQLRVDPARLHAGRELYRVSVMHGDTTDTIGTHSVTQSAADYGGRRVWVLAEQRAGRAVSLDSLVIDSASARPVHWGGMLPLSHLALELANDTLYGVIASSQGRASVNAGVPPNAMLTGAGLAEALLQAPLSLIWTDSTSIVVADVAGVAVLPSAVMVEREESVNTLAGRFDCWVVKLAGAFGELRLWVARDGRAIVRREQALPRAGGVLVEELVVLERAAP